MPARTLQQIKEEISLRLQSNELLPSFIERTADFIDFSDSIAEMISPYIKQLEDFLYIWDDAILLSLFLKKRGMFLVGNETLNDLQTIAQNRIKILSWRGTPKMLAEVRRLSGGDTDTILLFKDSGECGWVCGKTSPCYKESIDDDNYCYLSLRKVLIFKVKNVTKTLSNEDMLKILKYYFEPKHINVLYKFI